MTISILKSRGGSFVHSLDFIRVGLDMALTHDVLSILENCKKEKEKKRKMNECQCSTMACNVRPPLSTHVGKGINE